MARGPCTFRQHDLKRALKATVAAGLNVVRIEIDREGKFVIVPANPAGEHLGNVTSWDSALSK